MKTKVSWDGTDQDLEKLKAENAGKRLVAVQDHEDEKSLVFDDAPAAPLPLSLEERVSALESRMTAAEKKP